MSLLLKNISLPLTDFVLEVETEMRGRVTVIFGPSGAGKTSLLDLVAGLRRAKSAFIQLDDRVLTDSGRNILVPAHQRAIGYVPQDLALFPPAAHGSAGGSNLPLGIGIHGRPMREE